MSIFKNTLCLLICVLLVKGAGAQSDKPYVAPTGLNNWFVEVCGSSMFYSLNYEKVLHRGEKTGVVGRVGLGYNPFDYRFLNTVFLDRHTMMAPFTSSFLYGGGKEKIEVGLGVTLLAKNINDREIVPTAVLGFRVIEMNRIFFRVSYTPFIRGGRYVDWFGVSLGRNFNFK